LYERENVSRHGLCHFNAVVGVVFLNSTTLKQILPYCAAEIEIRFYKVIGHIVAKRARVLVVTADNFEFYGLINQERDKSAKLNLGRRKTFVTLAF
jgi:hypothetical protein